MSAHYQELKKLLIIFSHEKISTRMMSVSLMTV